MTAAQALDLAATFAPSGSDDAAALVLGALAVIAAVDGRIGGNREISIRP